MAFDVFLYTFSKRKNSTAQPTGGDEFLCTVKEQSGILSPTLGMDFGKGYSPAHFNYAYIPSFNRYYFITEWNFTGGLWWASLSVDVLASWKTQIGASTQYVVRSAAQWDGNIMDRLYPTTSLITTDIAGGPWDWVGGIESGEYVVGIINRDGNTLGAVSYYVFTNSQFRVFCQKLLDDSDWLGEIADISTNLLKALFNPFQYITSCMWFPFSVPSGTQQTTITFGWWEISGIGCAPLADGGVFWDNSQFNLAQHPQASRGSYLNQSPFTRRTLDFSVWGLIPIDTTYLLSGNLYADVRVDCITGIGYLYLSNDGNAAHSFASYQAQVGVTIQLAQIAANYLGMADSAVGFIGSLASTVLGLGDGAAISGVVESAMPQLMSSGKNGSIGAFSISPRLISEFFGVTDDSLEHRGRPLCKDIQLSTIPGYIMVSDPDVSLPALDSELEQISTFMTGGFYYE